MELNRIIKLLHFVIFRQHLQQTKSMIHTANKQYKIVLVGDSAVGKSSILNRFVDDQFADSLLSTIGVDFKFRKIILNGKQIKLQIWDTAGQQIFRAIVSAYYNTADAIVAVYDVSSYQSFENLKDYWLPQIENQNRSKAKVFIFGNKTDLPKRQVEPFNIQNLMEANKVQKCYQVSAKNSTNVENAFTDITRILQGDSFKDTKSISTVSSSNIGKQVQKQKKQQSRKDLQSMEQKKNASSIYQSSKQQQKKESRFSFGSWRKKPQQTKARKQPKKQQERVIQKEKKVIQTEKKVKQTQKKGVQAERRIQTSTGKLQQNIRRQMPKREQVIRVSQYEQPIKQKPKQNVTLKRPPTRNVSYSKQCCPT